MTVQHSRTTADKHKNTTINISTTAVCNTTNNKLTTDNDILDIILQKSR